MKQHRFPNLDAERRKRGMTQRQFADLLGISPDALCDRQRGKIKANCPAYWQRYAEILDVSAEYLMEEDPNFA